MSGAGHTLDFEHCIVVTNGLVCTPLKTMHPAPKIYDFYDNYLRVASIQKRYNLIHVLMGT